MTKRVTSLKMLYPTSQRKIARRLHQILFGRRYGRTITRPDGSTYEVRYSLCDPYLSRLCVKGQPKHHSTERWQQHLNVGRDKAEQVNRLHACTVSDLAVHLFGRRPDSAVPLMLFRPDGIAQERVYVVGPASSAAEHLLTCIDIDDKSRRGDAKDLLARLIRAFPILHGNTYVEESPGGFGIHVYLIISHQGVHKQRVNEVLTELGSQLRVLVPANGDGACMDGVKCTSPWYRTTYHDDGTRVRTVGAMGTMCSAPRPTTEADLARLAATPTLPIEALTVTLNVVVCTPYLPDSP